MEIQRHIIQTPVVIEWRHPPLEIYGGARPLNYMPAYRVLPRDIEIAEPPSSRKPLAVPMLE